MNKIGTYGVEGSSTQWPDVTISGRVYRWPAPLRNIGGLHFVVLDWPTAPDTDALIADLLKPARKVKKAADDADQ